MSTLKSYSAVVASGVAFGLAGLGFGEYVGQMNPEQARKHSLAADCVRDLGQKAIEEPMPQPCEETGLPYTNATVSWLDENGQKVTRPITPSVEMARVELSDSIDKPAEMLRQNKIWMMWFGVGSWALFMYGRYLWDESQSPDEAKRWLRNEL